MVGTESVLRALRESAAMGQEGVRVGVSFSLRVSAAGGTDIWAVPLAESEFSMASFTKQGTRILRDKMSRSGPWGSEPMT